MSSGPSTSEHHLLEITCHWFSLCLWALDVVADLKWNTYLIYSWSHLSSITVQWPTKQKLNLLLQEVCLFHHCYFFPCDYKSYFMPSSFSIKWMHKAANNSLSTFVTCGLCSSMGNGPFQVEWTISKHRGSLMKVGSTLRIFLFFYVVCNIAALILYYQCCVCSEAGRVSNFDFFF